MRLLPKRFEDPAIEHAFLRAERAERGRAIRALIVIAGVTLFLYMIVNPLHFPRAGVVAYAAAAGSLIALMTAYFLLTRTSFWLERSWLDLPVFVVLGAGMMALALALAGQAEVTGFRPHSMVLIQMGILVVFASVGFVACFRLFLIWGLMVLAGFSLWLGTIGIPDISLLYASTNFSTFLIFALYFNWDMERRAREVFAARLALDAERAKTEALLYNVLPQEVAARLREGEAVADAFSDLTVLFVDLVGFSTLAQKLSPGHLVTILNRFFSAADRSAERHGLEKVKTIGDAYLAVAGGMGSRDADSRSALAFSRDLIAELEQIAGETGIPLKARIGIHTGPAVGGVIGTTRLAYDYWGDTMNIASRLQAVAPPNGIAASESTYFQTRQELDYESQTAILKGIGEVNVHIARLGSQGVDGSPSVPE